MTKNEINLFTFRIINIFLVLILILLSQIGYTYNILGLAILFIIILTIFMFNPKEIITGFPYYMILLPMIIGGFLIEKGVYLFEIDKHTYENGTFLISLFFSLIFIEFILYPVKKTEKIREIEKKSKLIEIIIIISIAVLYLYFIKTGVPIIKGIHRSEYFSSIVPYYINLIKGRFSFFCLVLGTYYIKYKNKRYLFLFSLIIFYYLLSSIKGGELIIAIYMFSLPIILAIKKDYKSNREIRKKIIIIISSLLILVVGHYATVENYSKKTNAADKLILRMTAAGQIWWAIADEKQVDKINRPQEFIDNLKWDNKKYNKGMNQLMNEVTPEKYLDEWRSNERRGRSLANGFPAIGYYYFGYLGAFLITIIMGLMVYNSKKIILRSIEKNDVISFLFLGSIIEVIIRVVAQGDIQLFFEKRFYIILLAYISYIFIKLLLKKLKERKLR